jgi:hypothetical protein
MRDYTSVAETSLHLSVSDDTWLPIREVQLNPATFVTPTVSMPDTNLSHDSNSILGWERNERRH